MVTTVVTVFCCELLALVYFVVYRSIVAAVQRVPDSEFAKVWLTLRGQDISFFADHRMCYENFTIPKKVNPPLTFSRKKLNPPINIFREKCQSPLKKS